MSQMKPGLEAANRYDQTIKHHGTEIEQIALKLGIQNVKDQDLSSLGDWFASRRNIPLDQVSITGSCRSSDGGLDKPGRDGPGKAGEQPDKDQTQAAHNFLKHITISRDQTKEQKNLEEQLALQALLERNCGLSLEALGGNLEKRTPGSRRVDTDDEAPLFGTEKREGAYAIEDINTWREIHSRSAVNILDTHGVSSTEGSGNNLWHELFESGSDKSDSAPSSQALSVHSEASFDSDSIEDLPYHTRTRQSTTDRSSQSGSSGSMSSRSSIVVRRSGARPSPDIPNTQKTSHGRQSIRNTVAFLEGPSKSARRPKSIGSAPTDGQMTGDYEDTQAANELPMNKINLRHKIEELTVELENLKGQLGEDTEPWIPPTKDDHAIPWRTIYRIKSKPYLGKPEWMHGDEEIKLIASMPVINVLDYIDRHPELLFLVFKDYVTDTYRDQATPTDEFYSLDVLPPPVSDTESILITSRDMRNAVEVLVEAYPDFYTVFPSHDFMEEIPAPYFFLFHMFPQWKENVSQLKIFDQGYVNTLFKYLQVVFVPIYEDTLKALASGKVSGKHIPFLVKPGDILVQLGPVPQGFIATSWVKPVGTFHDKKKNSPSPHKGRDGISRERLGRLYRKDAIGKSDSNTDKDGGADMKDPYGVWTVTGWNWVTNGGCLYKNAVTLELYTNMSKTKVFNINEMDWFPLRYASDEIKELLLERGHKFWRCRTMQFVGYAPLADSDDVLESANERFMIDFATYRRLHPGPKKSSYNAEERDSDADIMIQENPPEDETINLFPSMVIGYNLRLKKWHIEVDRICEVGWNKNAFENLVVDEETKHLVKALISSQIKAERSTDLISGKGNGLIMLLHGGPGTGKTFTAESVAELAEKPLYRVTCGDIGTKPEDVEQYLESVLLLGKIWGCVVLLDEADVFLEERSLTDLTRNALVSVFLRILEYYDGILILTSNRVGTFDQAFKSRIQLALHYENLKKPQRRKIWRNFFNRLKDLGEQAINFDDLYDNIDELAEHDMNGRQIRNAITTARQLAQFESKDFSYTQLKHAIKVAGKFESYLKGVNQGFSDDQLARDSGFR